MPAGNHEYSLLPSVEPHEKAVGEQPGWRARYTQRLRPIIAVVLVLVVSFSAINLISSTNSTGICAHPRQRPEWRTLSPAEKSTYLKAAQCLTKTPSPRNLNSTVQDDLSWLHCTVGNYSHDAAPFLPWHRYFVHIYENALQEYCNYTGPMPYWDWSIDYQNLAESPIWNTDDGFGGSSGTVKSGVSGYCVADGPFAGFTPIYYIGERNPHCLSRDFRNEDAVRRAGNITVRPDLLEGALKGNSNYFDFLLSVESVSHLSIPYVVQGDFAKLTAPNDPVFYLHHAQVDRLWWSWQRISTERWEQYNGPSRNDLPDEAGLEDILDFGDFVSNKITVKSLMDTEGSLLCYQYDSSAL